MRITTAVLLFSFIMLQTQSLSAQLSAAGNRSESANPKIDQPREVLPTNPGQPAPKRPDFDQRLPGQQGTIPEIVDRPTIVVSPGEVRRTQEALKTRGYDPGVTSGSLHIGTQEALRQFQQDNDLPATGLIDEETAKQLGIDIRDKTPAAPQR